MKRVRFVQLVKWVQFGVGVLGVLLVVGILTRASAQGTHPVGGAEGVGFGTIDMVVDSGKDSLGAYQVEVIAPLGVEIVGLEGGEGVFKDAPFYDAKALKGRRMVVAAFSTNDSLPTGTTRVARLHLQVTQAMAGEGALKLENRLVVATDGDGKTIKANVTLKPFEGGK